MEREVVDKAMNDFHPKMSDVMDRSKQDAAR